MTAARRRRIGLGLGLALAAVALALLARRLDVDAVLGALRTLGWGGFAVLLVIQALLIAIAGLAWWWLLPPAASTPTRRFVLAQRFVLARLMRDSAAQILPFVQLGGVVLGLRVLTLSGVDAAMAMATAAADLAVEFLGELAYAALGLGLLAGLRPGDRLIVPLFAVLLVMALLGGGFVLALLRGTGLLARAAGWFGAGAAERVYALGQALRSIHARPSTLGAAWLVHFAAWILTGVQTWLTLRLMHVPASLGAALAIDSLTFGIRSLAFIVPSGLGVQEGAFVMLGGLFGISPGAALALALARRGRELVIGLPALLGWQIFEGRRAWRRAA